MNATQPIQMAPRTLFAPWSIGPLIATAACLGAWTIMVNLPWPGYLAFSAFIAFFLGVLYFLVQFIGRILFRQWLGAFWAAIRVAACVVTFGPVFMTAIFWGGDDDTDHFADKLIIPANIEISKPLPAQVESLPGEGDIFQKAVVTSVRREAGPMAIVIPSVPSLRNLVINQKPLLIRYLESSPAWRVYTERGGLYATRRWKTGARWISSLNGFYTWTESLSSPTKDGINRSFQVRTNLDLSGTPWMPTGNATEMMEGTTPSPVTLRADNGMDSSSCLIDCGGKVVLEIFDQSPGPGRRLTQSALAQLEVESREMLDHKEFDPSLLPVGSIRRGKPSLDLYTGTEPGIYDAEVWVNPGEEGTVYLKAYEITKNTPLSAEELYKSSNERIGWSADPKELFLSATNIMIYEGDWEHPYAARFELWFKPDSGGQEKILLTRNFIIEGWER